MKVKDKGVNRININFSGSGDSGDIDDIEYYQGDEEISSAIEVKESDENVLKDFAYDIICSKVDTVGDWVNNEGGFGNIEINTETNHYTLNYSQRTTEDYDWSDCQLFI
jgi:hypothetical protein